MGKAFRYKQSELEDKIQKDHAWLNASTKRIQANEIAKQHQQELRIYQIVDLFKEHAVRDPITWKKVGKSKSNDKRLISLVKHTFAKYKVPEFLEAAWIEAARIHIDNTGNQVLPLPKKLDFRLWYICVGRGESLYKKFGKELGLSRMDLHHFLNFPYETSEPSTAIWYGLVISKGSSPRIATMIWRSKLSRKDITNEFWKSVANWFIHNPPESVAQINDIVDYLNHRRTEGGENFTMKGRNLESVLKGMSDWHYELRRMKSIGGGSWAGMPIDNCDIPMGPEDDRQIWHFVQIKTGDKLAQEGNKMHHCVWSYKRMCQEGKTFIWSASMTHKNKTKDYLTIEINLRDTGYHIVQVRGFANRPPNNYEREMVNTWAQKEGLIAGRYY